MHGHKMELGILFLHPCMGGGAGRLQCVYRFPRFEKIPLLQVVNHHCACVL